MSVKKKQKNIPLHMLFLFIVFCQVLFTTQCTHGDNGVDVSTSLTKDEWTCLHDNYNVDFMISRAWHSTGSFDNTSVINLLNINSINTNNNNESLIKHSDIYLFPCRSMSAADQINQLISNLFKYNVYNLFGMLWFDIEYNPDSQCSWSNYTNEENCDYILSLGEAATNIFSNYSSIASHSVGIYSGHHGWGVVFNGNYSYCKEANIYPLWFPHYDGMETFSDYDSLAIGGWTQPNMKQYNGSVTECQANVDLDWYPTS